MSFSCEFLDELIREFLLFRGFAATLRAFDNELKNEKEKAFRPDRVVEQIGALISSHDLTGLRELWGHLEAKLFARLDPIQSVQITKLEAGLYKLYVINAIQNKRPEKVRDFFERMTPELHLQHEFRDWFALPFVVNPESHPTFSTYFSRQWQDTLLLSLQNFLSVVFLSIPPPKLADFGRSNEKIQRLKDENRLLKSKLFQLVRQQQQARKESDGVLTPVPQLASPQGSRGPPKLSLPEIRPPDDVMDDFFIIAQEVQSGAPSGDSQVKGLKSFLRNLSDRGLPSPSGIISGSGSRSSNRNSAVPTSPKPRTSPRTSSATPVGGTPAKQHAPLARVSQGSVNPATTPVLKTAKEVESSTFILLSQEEYNEHHSEVTHCRFSKATGNLIASSDVDGVVKVWSACPRAPNTLVTFVSSSAVTALDWLSKVSDRFLVVGNANGSLKVCDQLERKTCHEVNVGAGIVMVEAGNGANGSYVAVSTSGPSVPDHTNPDPSNPGNFAVYDLKSAASGVTRLEHSFSPTIVSAGDGSSPVITCCKFNHDSQMVITGATDGKIRIFDLRRRDCISSWSVCDVTDGAAGVTTLQQSADETSVYSLSESGNLTQWSLVQTGQKMQEATLANPDFPYFNDRPSFPRNSLSSPMFTFTGSDERHFLACSTDGGDICKLKSGQAESHSSSGCSVEKVLGLRGHSSHVTCVDWSHSTDHGPCVTASSDGRIKVSTLLCQ